MRNSSGAALAEELAPTETRPADAFAERLDELAASPADALRDR